MSSQVAVRVDLAACYRLVALSVGRPDLHAISARYRAETHFLSPYGSFSRRSPLEPVRSISRGEGRRFSHDIIPGFTSQRSASAARGALRAAPPHYRGVAVSAHKDGLLPISQQSLFPLSRLLPDYRRCAEPGESPRSSPNLGEMNFMILRTTGFDVRETVADALSHVASAARVRSAGGHRAAARADPGSRAVVRGIHALAKPSRVSWANFRAGLSRKMIACTRYAS